MYEQFLEIAYESELDINENPELDDLAFELCNEVSDTRAACIAELRQMIYESDECRPHRTDDAFLLRFLRSRGFIVKKAYRHMIRYYKFRAKYPYLYKDVDLFALTKVKDAYMGQVVSDPAYGRITVMRFGKWDPSEFPTEDLVKAGMAMLEIGIRQPKSQIMGGVLIVDMDGIAIRHVATLTPTIAYQIIALCGTAFPNRMSTCHIINYSWIINTFFYLFKRFIPQNFWNRIFFHGYDMKSLHQHIKPDNLPKEYGGTNRDFVTFGQWITKIKKYRDDAFVKDMKELGYLVKE